jgi:hypothetical protein
MTFQPSPEQEAIFNYVQQTRSQAGQKGLAVAALAGTGKTTTIVELIKRTPGISGIYCAFNKDIVSDVEPKLKGTAVFAKTFHSMGYSVLMKHVNATRFNPDGNKYRALAENFVNRETVQAVLNEIVAEIPHSDDRYERRQKLQKGAISTLEGMCDWTRIKLVVWEDADQILAVAQQGGVVDEELASEYDLLKLLAGGVKTVMGQAETALKEKFSLDFTDMIYWIVRWDLSIPQYTWVFADEVQDMNPLQRAMIRKSLAPNGFLIAVGDVHQCVIAGTMIDNRPVEQLQTWDVVPAGFGRGKVARAVVQEVFSREVKDQPVITIETRGGHKLTTTAEHTHFAGYLNHQGESEPFFVYLMYKTSHGYRVGITRKYRVANKQSLGFKIRANQENADALWLLKCCATEQEAHYWEDYFAAHYGLPTCTFKHVAGSPKSAGLALTQELIDRLYASLDTPSRAKRLLHDLGISFDHPHYNPKCMTKSRRRNVTITMCSDPRGDKVLHYIEMSGSDLADIALLATIGIQVTNNGKGTGWRLRQYSQNLGELHRTLEKIQSVMDVNVIQLASLAPEQSLPLTPASNVLPGMMVFVKQDKQVVLDEVVNVTRSLYSGTVYDLNIAEVHNYCANGIFTHNSIYAFAGADSDSWQLTVQEFKCHILPLTVTRRCAAVIVAHAQRLVPEFQAVETAPRGKIVWLDENRLSQFAEPGDMVISRIKSPLVGACFDLLAVGKPATILGSDIGKALIKLLEKIAKRKGFTFADFDLHLTAYQDEQVQKFIAKHDEAAAENLTDQCSALRVIFERATPTSIEDFQAETERLFSKGEGKTIKLCTAHKSKGLEAERVFLLAPERFPLTMKNMTPEQVKQEDNLEYVAITRAKATLVYLTNKKFLVEKTTAPYYVSRTFEEAGADLRAAAIAMAEDAVVPAPIPAPVQALPATTTISTADQSPPDPLPVVIAPVSPVGESPLRVLPPKEEVIKVSAFKASGNLSADMQGFRQNTEQRIYASLKKLTLQDALTLRELLDEVIADLEKAV